MMRYERTNSSMFLMEIIINILLFSILCVCSLQFFIKALNLSEDTTTLHHAVSACNNVAAIYETGDGTMNDIWETYPYAIRIDGQIMIYLDENYEECSREEGIYCIVVNECNNEFPSVEISFHEIEGEAYYSINAYYYQPLTPSTVSATGEEVSVNE